MREGHEQRKAAGIQLRDELTSGNAVVQVVNFNVSAPPVVP